MVGINMKKMNVSHFLHLHDKPPNTPYLKNQQKYIARLCFDNNILCGSPPPPANHHYVITCGTKMVGNSASKPLNSIPN